MRGSRGDCGVAVNLASITGCPGDIPCNGHGVCDEETFACGCEEGWRAADCSERTCPYGPAWYAYPTATDVAHVTREECSGMGTCDRTLGVCFCQDGFSGAACDVLACPGETAPCSGHGQCLTMQQLAQANGFVYRSTPDDPYTWDADAVRGCRCDEGLPGLRLLAALLPLRRRPAHDRRRRLEGVLRAGPLRRDDGDMRVRRGVWVVGRQGQEGHHPGLRLQAAPVGARNLVVAT